MFYAQIYIITQRRVGKLKSKILHAVDFTINLNQILGCCYNPHGNHKQFYNTERNHKEIQMT